MYLSHFGLAEAPFSIAPNPKYLFLGRRHQEALAHLIYGLRGEGGIVVLTGEVGTGKTTISRKLLEDIPENTDVAWIIQPRLSAVELLAAICDELHIEYDPRACSIKSLTDRLNEALLAAHAAGRNTVLMIDEAQNLSPELLEQLRLLTNLETSERKLLQIVLLGQEELKEMLRRHDLRQFAQRITARYELEPLTPDETRHYIRHRLAVAGCNRPLFGRREAKLVHRLSHGIPRLINLICDRALLGAFSQEKSRVGVSHIRQAAREVLGDAANPSLPLRRLAGSLAVIVLALLLWRVDLPVPSGWNERIQPAASEPASPDPIRTEATPAATALPETNRAIDVASSPPADTGESKAEEPSANLNAMLAGLLARGDQPTALATLVRLWRPEADKARNCTEILELGLQCLKRQVDLAGLRQLDRPALIRLKIRDHDAFAVLRHLDGEMATLQLEDSVWRLPIPELMQRWYAEATLLWHIPPGYRDTLRPGHRGPAVDWLVKSLDAVQGRMIPPHVSTSMDAVLVSRVRDFQRQNGLQADGAAGPLTLMRLNDALKLKRPHLGKTG